jgi:hypothetical protein
LAAKLAISTLLGGKKVSVALLKGIKMAQSGVEYITIRDEIQINIFLNH